MLSAAPAPQCGPPSSTSREWVPSQSTQPETVPHRMKSCLRAGGGGLLMDWLRTVVERGGREEGKEGVAM